MEGMKKPHRPKKALKGRNTIAMGEAHGTAIPPTSQALKGRHNLAAWPIVDSRFQGYAPRGCSVGPRFYEDARATPLKTRRKSPGGVALFGPTSR